MVAKNRGRYLAPIALVVVLVATVVVIRGGVASTPRAAPARVLNDRRPTGSHRSPRPRFYVIQAGDSLSAISVKTGVSVASLEALNPSVDPNTLQTGRRLRLRR